MTNDEIEKLANEVGARAFPVHSHFRGIGAGCFCAGYLAAKSRYEPNFPVSISITMAALERISVGYLEPNEMRDIAKDALAKIRNKE